MAFWKLKIAIKKAFWTKCSAGLQTIGDHIRKRRNDLGLLQKEVAKLFKVSEDTVTYWENDRAKPFIRYMPSIIQFLGYNPLNTENNTLGGRIEAYRIVHGLSFKKLAKLMRVDASTVASWEANKCSPHPKKLKELEKHLSAFSI